jgi:hypothetical protein
MRKMHTGHPRGHKHRAGMGKAHGKGAKDKIAGLSKLGSKMGAHGGAGTKPTKPARSSFMRTMEGLQGPPPSPQTQRRRAKRLEDKPI